MAVADAFDLVGLLNLGSALWIWPTMPDRVRPPALSLAARRAP